MEYSGGVSVGARATHMQTHTRVHTPQSWLLILRIDQPIYRSYRSLFPGLKRRQTDRQTDGAVECVRGLPVDSRFDNCSVNIQGILLATHTQTHTNTQQYSAASLCHCDLFNIQPYVRARTLSVHSDAHMDRYA